jgi:hypothetical protein
LDDRAGQLTGPLFVTIYDSGLEKVPAEQQLGLALGSRIVPPHLADIAADGEG